MMEELRLQYPISQLSRLLEVSVSGYHASHERPLSKHDQEESRLIVEIKASHQRTRGTYGAERLQHDLSEHGVQAGVCRIKRIRKKLGIRCIQKRKFKATTNSKHGLPVAENLLKQEFVTKAPNKIWVSDITYIPTDEGWLYLAGHKDLYTHEIVGYSMGERLTKNLVNESLLKAVTNKHPGKGLTHHSDRGSQYCAYEYRNLLAQYKMQTSMSGKGNCYDNAPMESFWGMLKQELIYHCHFKTRQEAKKAITEYIEIFYNRQRIQANLGFLSPAAYLRKYYVSLT
jgi:putative transposase